MSDEKLDEGKRPVYDQGNNPDDILSLQRAAMRETAERTNHDYRRPGIFSGGRQRPGIADRRKSYPKEP